MRKKLILLLGIALLVSAVGCYGPMSLTRTYDDWTNQIYVDSPWLAEILLYTGIIPAIQIITFVIDTGIGNPVDFWTESAFRGHGTPFQHRNPSMPIPR